MSFDGIDFHRGPGPGWQIATVYGLAPRALRFNLVHWMDGPGWKVEPATCPFGVRQEPAALVTCDAFLEGCMIRGPHPTLRAAKAQLRQAHRDTLRESR